MSPATGGRHAVTPYGRTGGSSRVRVFTWTDRVPTEARPRVHSYVTGHRASPGQLGRHPVGTVAAELDLRVLARGRPEWLLLHREASPLSRGTLERSLVRSAGFSVYDFDDALQHDRGEGPWWRRLFPKAPKAAAAVAAVDRVVAGNELLADWASTLARDVVVVPSCVDVRSYVPRSSFELGDPPHLVWIGSRDNEPVLARLAPVLLRLHRRFGARLTVIGAADASLPGLDHLVDRVPWSERAQHELLGAQDIGLMPLVDDAYSRGKCGYKLLQYAAAGLPAVASPVGVNASVLADLGLPAAATPDEWYDVLAALLSAPAGVREQLGTTARRRADERYSFDAWQGRWLEAVGLPAVPAGAAS